MAFPHRTVVTLGTVPGRAEQIVPVLEELLAQGPDRVYVWIPRLFRRRGRPGSIPPELARFSREQPALHVELVDDLGPITKLLPVTAYEPDPETVIVVTDDDSLVRHPDWLSGLVHNLAPRTAVGYSGFNFLRTCKPWRPLIACRHLEEVDVLEGYRGYALQRGWLDHGLAAMVRTFVADWDAHLDYLRVDDLIVSCYLQRIGVATRVLFEDERNRYNVVRRTAYYETDALHLENGGLEADLERFGRSYRQLLRLVEEHCAAGATAG